MWEPFSPQDKIDGVMMNHKFNNLGLLSSSPNSKNGYEENTWKIYIKIYQITFKITRILFSDKQKINDELEFNLDTKVGSIFKSKIEDGFLQRINDNEF